MLDIGDIYARALALLSEEQWEAALDAFRECVRRDPGSVEALYGIAHCLGALGNHREAVDAYERVLRSAPDLAAAHCGFGALLTSLGKNDLAERHLRRAISLDPSDPAAHNNLGLLLHKLGRHPEAIEAYKAALAASPGTSEVYDNMAVCFGEVGQWHEAVDVLEQAVSQTEGATALTFQNLAIALRALHRLDESEAAARHCLDLDPRNAEACTAMAGILADRGRWDEAVVYAERAIAIKGGTATSSDLFNLGVALAETGRLTDAAAALFEAIKRAPEDRDARLRLAAILIALNQLEHSVVLLEEVIRMRPHDAEAFGLLGEALHRLGKHVEAVTAFASANREDPRYFLRYPGMRAVLDAARAAVTAGDGT